MNGRVSKQLRKRAHNLANDHEPVSFWSASRGGTFIYDKHHFRTQLKLLKIAHKAS